MRRPLRGGPVGSHEVEPPLARERGTTAATSIGTLLTGRVIGMLLQFGAIVYAGKILGPDGFGQLQIFLVLALYLSLVADLGLSVVGTRNAAMGIARHLRPITIRRAWIGLGLGAAVVVIAFVMPFSPTDRAIGLCLAAGVAGTPLNLRWYLQGRRQAGLIAVADVTAAVVSLTAIVLLVRGPNAATFAVLAFTLGPLAGAMLTFVAGRSALAEVRDAPPPEQSLIRQAMPLGLAILATQLYYGADSILLSWFRGSAEVGWYGAAYRVVLACLAVPFAANAIALPVLAALRSTDDGRAEEFLGMLTRGLLALALPLAVGGTITAGVVLPFLFGDAFEPAERPFSLLIWSCVTVCANAPFAALMLANHRDRRYATITISGTVFNIIANLVAIPVGGMVGAAVVTVATEVLVAGQILFACRDVSGRILRPFVPRLVAAAAIMAIAIWPLRASLVAVPIGVVVFGVAAVMTGVIAGTDVRRLAAQLARSRP